MARILFLSSLLALSACSPLYLIRGACEEIRILRLRRPIVEVVNNPNLDQASKNKLQLVLQAREFAKSKGLEVGGAFEKYSDIGQENLLWVLVATKPDSFQPYTWWFPIVGRVPYKGFFDLNDAKTAAQKLQADGYEYVIRPSDAFSTLGWLDDPLLSTTLRNEPHFLVNTVIHESLHNTLWLKGNVDFNESLANFVGNVGAIEFFKGISDAANLAAARNNFSAELEISELIGKLYSALNSLYETQAPLSEKLDRRGQIFEEITGDFVKRHPQTRVLKNLNNAEILLIRVYGRNLAEFNKIYKAGDLQEFVRKIRLLAESDPDSDPFVNLAKEVQQLPVSSGN